MNSLHSYAKLAISKAFLARSCLLTCAMNSGVARSLSGEAQKARIYGQKLIKLRSLLIEVRTYREKHFLSKSSLLLWGAFMLERVFSVCIVLIASWQSMQSFADEIH